ncbi:MBL fold metallo-hydrolase [Acrocarpospora macrocephala]|uniref:MBL fold metallo-hydrolase n=1 Tax=Acrocarpospora macrocephala TaxID=150177 RepID=A0A5M3WTF9_9ACTN|nr:MBL fold metallo-hydrolase [Acrocarpospora macrocephala]GES11542.1 MBL fold metallo-hydrolase [Acrocarpospora macrocephala]
MTRAGVGEWTREGAYEIAPGIHRLPLPMPGDSLRAVNVYAIQDGAGVALVDGGWAIPEAHQVLEKSLNSIGHTCADVTRVIVTHAHIDHYTLAVWLRAEHGTPVLVGRGERDSLEWLAGAGPRHRHQCELLRRAGAPHLAAYMARGDADVDPVAEGWEAPDEWLAEGGIEIGGREFRVLETPGHTEGHIMVLSESDGLLFSGDQILPHITPSIGFEAVPRPQPLVAFLRSLARLRKLPDLRLLPAHGPAGMGAHARIDELAEHHRRRLEQSADAVARLGAATVAEVAAELPWTRHRREFAELDDFNSTLAVFETSAHLAYLVAEGTLLADEEQVPKYRLG